MHDQTAMALRALTCLDLTQLGDSDTPDAVDRLCDRAVTAWGNVAAVCIWPRFVERARRRLAGIPVRVAAVANFPHGGADIGAAVTDTRRIIDAGGDEVDVVFPYRAYLDGDHALGRDLVAACKEACDRQGRLKVILETGELRDREIIRGAAREALDGGADFLKTSTGKSPVSATLDAAEILLDTIKAADSTAGFKAAGGIRDLTTAITYLDLADRMMGPGWATPERFRFGASGLLVSLLAALAGEKDAGVGSGY